MDMLSEVVKIQRQSRRAISETPLWKQIPAIDEINEAYIFETLMRLAEHKVEIMQASALIGLAYDNEAAYD